MALAAVLVLGGTAAVPRLAFAGDPTAGADVFKSECSECHSTKEGHNKKGPSLFGVVGRKAATIPDFSYSDALRSHGDWVWTVDKLHWYLSQPVKQADPGTKMKYDGLNDPKKLDDLVSFLGSNH